MRRIVRPLSLSIFLVFFLFSGSLSAAEIRVAVASNFLIPLKYIAKIYEKETGDRVIISAGSTGKLYAQIVNGAPFDVFLAANSREPERLEKEGFALKNSRFTYAKGKLVLWDPKGIYQQETLEQVLANKEIKRLSLANPLTAPYRSAAMSVLQNLKLESSINRKILRGENISQAYQYVASGAADLGFVALSQIKARGNNISGRYWEASESLHSPIVQQAVVLKKASKNIQARSFLNYLKSSKGKAMIENFGYSLI